MIASAIKVDVATAMPSENVTKLELHPSITVVVFLSTLKLLNPRY